MRVVADYLHARGLKFGLYTDGGTETCSQGQRGFQIPGSYGHWQDDARTFAGWTMDYVKMVRMHDAVRAQPQRTLSLSARTRTGATRAQSGRKTRSGTCRRP
jgi:alpha-galactosidase